MFTTLYNDGSNVSDVTTSVKRKDNTGKQLVIGPNSSIYLGSILKFNSVFIALSDCSVIVGTTLKVELYDGRKWVSVAHIVDETEAMTENGLITFVPDKKSQWSLVDTEKITELSGVNIYSKYWIKLSASSDICCSIDYAGHKFSDDLDLFEEFAQLNDDQFRTFLGGDNFSQQAIRAAEIMEKDLIALGKGKGIEQVLNADSLALPSISKVAEIIYSQFGDEYRDLVGSIRSEYNSRLRKAMPIIDNNNSGSASDNFRKSMTMGILKR